MAKLTVQFSEEATDRLDKLAGTASATKTEILRRALALYDYVEQELKKEEGRNLSITSPDGAPLKDIILH